MPYSGNPASSQLDAVRFLAGDTDDDDPKLTDEEWAFLVSRGGSDEAIAAAGLLVMAARVSDEHDISIDGLSESASQRFKQLMEAGSSVAGGGGGGSSTVVAIPWAGGIYYADDVDTSATIKPMVMANPAGGWRLDDEIRRRLL